MKTQPKKRAYFNKRTQEIKYFTYIESMRLNKRVWQYVPKIENFINEEGKHQVRLTFDDFVVDMVETDESIAANETNKSIISGVEVVENGDRSAK